MDLIRQNKFIGWSIAVLVALNILTLSIIWMQSGKAQPPAVKEQGAPPPGPAELMRREIGLSAAQTVRFDSLRMLYQQQSRAINEERDGLRLRIAEEIFNPRADQRHIDTMVARIGSLQSKIEIMRYENFRDLVELCNTEQKAKLRPVLREVFGKNEARKNPEQRNERREEKKQAAPDRDDRRPRHDDDRPAPPSSAERISRYSDRLSLTPDQSKKLEEIFSQSKKDEETFKSNGRPSPEEFEKEKMRIRKIEDDRISRMLTQEQKMEFEKMVQNRRKN